MHIHSSDVLESYLTSNGRTKEDLLEYQNSRLNNIVLAGNLLYVSVSLLVGLAVVGVVGLIVSWVFDQSFITESIVCLSVAALGFGGIVYTEYQINDQPTVLSAPEVSITEFRSLLRDFCEVTKTDERVISRIPLGEVREIAAAHLTALAREIKRLEGDGKQVEATTMRMDFRRDHAVMFKLGVVEGRWNKYFQQ